ncbi:MAG: hypothetical protein PSV13_10630 [Lacunisphaera sp.]|nr:hypothetical protein [Lacunisphaera sp.]
MLTFSSRNLNEDCSAVMPGREERGVPIEAEAALERLRAFAKVPAVALVDSDARIYLANGGTKLAVQNENGRLYAQRVPESAHTADQQTPEEIVGFLTGEQAVAFQMSQDNPPEFMPAGPSHWRSRLNTGWIAGVLAVVAVVVAYYTFAPAVPAGIQMISDPVRVASLHTKFNGRYGDAALAGSTTFLVENGRFIVQPAGEAGVPGEPLMDSSYRYGLRGDDVVLVVANGAVLEPGKDGSLRFNDAAYPRISSR